MIDAQLGLFAKFWQPGYVKTRLAKTVGDHVACEIYQIFLTHLIGTFANTCRFQTIVVTPAEKQSAFKSIAADWETEAQTEGDLGQRMSDFFEASFRRSHADNVPSKVIVIGADCPHLSVDYVTRACSLLEENDIVIGPSTDGGYYLIAIKNGPFQIFENINWSTESVLPQTLERVRAENLKVQLLPELTDVDEIGDLELLIGQLKKSCSTTDQKLYAEINSILESPGRGRGEI